jgi:hypothetical protein
MRAHRPDAMILKNLEGQVGALPHLDIVVVMIKYILNVWEVRQQKASHDPPVQRQCFQVPGKTGSHPLSSQVA